MTTPRTLTIELDLPSPGCSPNYHGHWRAKHDAVQAAKAEAYIEAIRAASRTQTSLPLSGRVILTAEFYLCRTKIPRQFYYPRDEDNAIACLKASIDGLKDAGVIVGDTAKALKIGGVNLYSTAKQHKGLTGVSITLTESTE